ncbi:MAG: ABC transporter ATP-binding protein [Verrucomicrobiota bacterium]|nr:ABC transporter ATP-binding protein [Verrucomicrobiota bacterium]
MSTPTHTVLEVSGISKHYRSGLRDITVLTGASFAVRTSESLSIRGESGSGKTTLLNIAAGLEIPNEGEVFWEGATIEGHAMNRLAVRRAGLLGLVFQSYLLIPEFNALENVLFAARLVSSVNRTHHERAEQLLVGLGLKDRLQSSPGTLSGGERQRVAIARALMNRPKVILADEPTGNLDEKTAGGVMEQFVALCRTEGASLVLVTHNPAFAAMADKQLWLRDGKLFATAES